MEPQFKMGNAIVSLLEAFHEEGTQAVFFIDGDVEPPILTITFRKKVLSGKHVRQDKKFKIDQFYDSGEPNVAFDHILTQMHNEFVTFSKKEIEEAGDVQAE